MKQIGACLRIVLLAVLLPLPALAGCVTTHDAPLCRTAHGFLRDARWVQCLGDAQLSVLDELALTTAGAPRSPTSAQDKLSFEIAHRYIALRAQQTALVLMAAREELDRRAVAMVREQAAGGQTAGAAAAQLAATRLEQSRTREQIAGLRERLAVLTGLAPGLLDRLPGGPIPLPPAPAATGASARYDEARAAAVQAQSQAEHSRTIAALAEIRARAGKLPPGAALTADRQALDALQAEQQARAAMIQAYVALAGSSWRSVLCPPADQPPRGVSALARFTAAAPC